MNERKAVVWFLLISFGVAWPLFLLPLAFGPVGSQVRQMVALVSWSAAMWAPGLAAIVATRFIAGQSLHTLRLRHLGPKLPYLWAWLLPLALTIVSGLFTLLLGAGRLDLSFESMREAMAQAPGGSAVAPGLLMAIGVAFSLTVAPLFNTLLALGEELGWRGFLLPRLSPGGQWRAILLSGIVWGVWHAPAILQGHNYPGRPVLGVFMMIVFCLLMGTIFSWLYLQTRSPWTPALAHGSLNATAGLPLLFLRDVDIVIGGTVTSIVGWIGLAAFVGWLVLSRRLPIAPDR